MRVRLAGGELRDEIVTKLFHTLKVEAFKDEIEFFRGNEGISNRIGMMDGSNILDFQCSYRIFGIHFEVFAQSEESVVALCEMGRLSLVIGDKLYWEAPLRQDEVLSSQPQNVYFKLSDTFFEGRQFGNTKLLVEKNLKHWLDVPPMQTVQITLHGGKKESRLNDKILGPFVFRVSLDVLLRRTVG